MNILIILGSIRTPSLTRILAKQVESRLKEKGFLVEWADFQSQPLPIADPDYHSDLTLIPSQAVRNLAVKVSEADGIILASPLYHGSYSGVLKNALDSLVFDAFRGKPIGLLAHGSGAKRCAQPAEHLLPVVQALYGYSLQCQVASSSADFKADEASDEFVLVDKEVQDRCDRLANEMRRFLQ